MQTAAGKAATDKRAAAAKSKQVEKLRREKEKAERENEALRQKVAKFESGDGPTSDEQPSPAPASGPDKAKLAELETKEKQLKEILKNCAGAALSKVLVDTQGEIVAIRSMMQLAKDPADVFEETSK